MISYFQKAVKTVKKNFEYRRKYQNFKRDLVEFKKLSDSTARRFPLDYHLTPYLLDNTSTTAFDPHYLYHPAWAARILKKTAPEFHVDISSTLYFCSIVSAFVPVKFYDFRPADLRLEGLSSEPGNLMDLPFEDNSIKSLSCMHTIEHIGLGRYGDPLDYDGDIKALRGLKRVLSSKGNLLLVVPVGRPRIVFNAHRIYSYRQIGEFFSDFHLKEFSLVPDNFEDAGFIRNATEELADKQEYGCGCFWLVKP